MQEAYFFLLHSATNHFPLFNSHFAEHTGNPNCEVLGVQFLLPQHIINTQIDSRKWVTCLQGESSIEILSVLNSGNNIHDLF